jgi:hypothetical protein
MCCIDEFELFVDRMDLPASFSELLAFKGVSLASRTLSSTSGSHAYFAEVN